MTSQENPIDQSSEIQSEEPDLLTSASPDWFLQDIVSFANYFQLNTLITLNLGGATVSGDVISAAEYFRGMADTFKESFSFHEELAGNLHQMISGNVHELAVDDFENRPSPAYIHLKNVRTYAPGRPQLAVHSNYWRGRISQVSGFSYGYPPVPGK